MSISHEKILNSQKLGSPLGLPGLKNFHGFVTLGERMVRIAFIHFLWPWNCGKFYFVKSLQKSISDMTSSSKNSQKTSKCSNGETQKESNITY